MLQTSRREPEAALRPQHERRHGGAAGYAAVAAAIVLGCLVRAAYVLPADFPLNDGGLFYAMTRDLQEARYLLPAVTSYNAADIPYSYPPFGFYMAGLLDDLTPLSLLDVFQFLPLMVTVLTIPAFYLLARAMLASRVAVAAAVFAFALVPRSFVWLIMGGGVTRSWGLLFALLALYQVHQMYTRRSRRSVLPAALCAGLTVLSHLETGWFLAYSSGVFFLAYGRHRQGLISSLLVAAGTLVITAPWWGTVLAHHGPAPFLAANDTGGSVFSNGEVRREVLLWLARFGSTSEPLFPLIGSLAVLGALAAVAMRQVLLPAWWAVIILLDWRAFKTYSTVPVALLAGLAVACVILPLLRRLSVQAPAILAAGPSTNGHGEAHPPTDRPAPGWLAPLVLAFGLCYATASALTTDPPLGSETAYLVSLSRDERVAMRWVGERTPPSSRFLVLTDQGWPTDKTPEWFPVLARRVSVATVQGHEWMPNGRFAWMVRVHDYALGCGIQTVTCLDNWYREMEIPFTHVYVAKTPASQCCWNLLVSLDADPRYELVFDGPGATIYARRWGGGGGGTGAAGP